MKAIELIDGGDEVLIKTPEGYVFKTRHSKAEKFLRVYSGAKLQLDALENPRLVFLKQGNLAIVMDARSARVHERINDADTIILTHY